MPKKLSEKKFKVDSDADGLSDKEEIRLGTDPKSSDTDHDGLSDFEEVKIFDTDPKSPDTDHDGVSDAEEVKRGTNPRGVGFLKDYFIPHSLNGYKPKALHIKRLAFHAGAALVLKVILVAFVLSFPVQAWLTPSLLAEQSQAIIRLTNELRASLSLPLLRVNDKLAHAALNKAEDMLINQYFAHVSPQNFGLRHFLTEAGYDYRVAGENLALGFVTPEEVVTAWQNSPTHYANLIDTDYQEIGVAMVGGNYQSYDTTLVAQYFGATETNPSPFVAISNAAQIVEENNQDAQVLSESVEAEVNEIVDYMPSEEILVDKKPPAEPQVAVGPQIDAINSFINSQTSADGKEIIIQTEVLVKDAVAVELNIQGTILSLGKDDSQSDKWIYSGVLEDINLIHPTTLATIVAKDASGVETQADIAWKHVTQQRNTAVAQYTFIKENQSPYVSPLFDISRIYLQILLGIAILAFVLNILIEVKKQHPKTILASVFFVGFLAILIMV